MLRNIAWKIQQRSVVKQSDRLCVGPKDSPLISSLSALLRQSQSISEAFSLLLVRDLFSARILLTSQIYFVPSPIKEGDRILNYHKKVKLEETRNKLCNSGIDKTIVNPSEMLQEHGLNVTALLQRETFCIEKFMNLWKGFKW